MMPTGPTTVLGHLQAQLGSDLLCTDPGMLDAVRIDHRRLYQGKPLALALPRSTAEVAKILALCNRLRVGVVPQGGNTGYCGAATPDESGTQLVLSLRRMKAIRRIDPLNYSLTVESGCILSEVQKAAAAADRYFPLSLGAEDSCQIGGNLSTNAGGLNVLRYGMARDLVLGLEVVLADGRVLSSLSGLRKDNTGYDVSRLFVGAEGTLGIITAATLRLFPQPAAVATALVAVPSIDAALTLLEQLRARSGDRVSSFELLPQIALELVTRHIASARLPLTQASPWFVLCEITGSHAAEDLHTPLEETLTAALESTLATDAVLAQSERERQDLWQLRESVPEAQRRDGVSLKHDVSLPLDKLTEFVVKASEWLASDVPEGKLVCYGHLGDGNLHFNINQAGTDAQALLARGESIKRRIHDLVHELGGSFSAEHGIGRLKVAELERYASPVELELMRSLKRALDPNGIMNPGKVLSAPAG